MSIINSTETLKMMLGIRDKKIPDFETRLEKTKEKIIEDVQTTVDNEKTKTLIKDSYGNSLTAVGTDDKVKSFANYGFSNETINWPLWLALYNDSWDFRRAIDKPAQDMIRAGFTINNIDDINKANEVYNVVKSQRSNLINLIQWGRLFGGAIAVVMFDNFTNEDYSKPININKLKQAKVMSLFVTDRWYGCSASDKTVSNMNNVCDYGKPESYRITFSDGNTITVHHDFILRYEGRTAPRFLKDGALQGWGYAEGTHILNELARDDELKASITSLLNKALIEVIKMPGMRGLFMGTDNENEAQIRARLEMVNRARTYNSLTFLDSDDEYQEHSFSGLSGLSDLLATNMWLVSSALEMQGVLFGDLKQGFSNDENALERYDETINNLNENYFRVCLHKLLLIIYKWKGIDEDVAFEFGSLIRNKQDKDRIEGMKDFQQLLSALLQDGVLTPKQCAIAIKNFGEKGIINLGITDADIEKMDDEFQNEMENIDLDK